MIEFAAVAGLDETGINTDAVEVPIHNALIKPLRVLREAAWLEGFDLALASGYRSYERQLAIWNAKAEGQRPLLDDDGNRLDPGQLDEVTLMFAILRWSALPGASRHHWGSDFDLYDKTPCNEGYRLNLSYEETVDGAVFGKFHRWLSQYLANEEAVFFRPYQSWHGGVAPEPWHLSFAPLAQQYQQALNYTALRQLVMQSRMALKDAVLAHFDEIFRRFVWVAPSLYPPRYGGGIS